jgi:hypothetical protein
MDYGAGSRALPSYRAEIAFLYDPFVRLAWTLDSIFELPISLGQLRHDLVCPARRVAIEDRGLQYYASSEPEFMRGVMRQTWSRVKGGHAITFQKSDVTRSYDPLRPRA